MRKQIFELYKKGYTYREIAGIVGRSYQRIHQIINNYSLGHYSLSYANLPNLTLQGILCQDCKERGENIHHIDKNSRNNDDKNLVLLCVGCHVKRHKKMRRTIFQAQVAS